MIKLTEIFLNKYTEKAGLSKNESLRHKKHLFAFFKDFSNCINDYQVWRLFARVKAELGEPVADIKVCKMSEIRSLMKINWHVELNECKKVERAVCDLVELLGDTDEMTKEERAFIKTTAMSVEEGLQRKF